jgi:methyltransferase
MSRVLFTALVALVGIERLAELVVSARHTAWARSRGGVEFGRRHYPPMAALHSALLAGAVAETWLADRPFLPLLGWPMLAVVVLAQALRWWCIRTLGPQWNTRVIVVPGLSRVRRGPYRVLAHPNYVAVAAEGLALPLVHTAWVTALVFTALNTWLLTVRIKVENGALAAAAGVVP